jgi:uncharacterized phage-associated protein
MNIKARNIAKFFYEKNNELTEKQLQKLTYYAYVWYLIKFRHRLFNESPQAWIHGPVFMSLYKDIKNNNLVTAESIDLEKNKDIKLILEVVDKHYRKYSGNDLERMTHSEMPWKKARQGLSVTEKSQNKISDEDIIEYYSA